MLGSITAAVLLFVTSITSALGAGKAALPLSASLEGHARQALANGECFTARTLVEKMIMAGEPIGHSVRGEMYERGVCAPRDWSKAAENYGLAMRHGHWLAQAHLGYLALNGGPGLPRDVGWAIEVFRSLALDLAVLEPEHRPMLVRALMRQRGIPRQLADAMAWVREIEASEPRVLYETASKLRTGTDTLPRKERIARHWMHKAARRGIVDADFTLAMWFLEEPRDEHDLRRGLRHLSLAAERGHLDAIEEIAKRLATGHDVLHDNFNAFILFLRLKQHGVAVDQWIDQAGARLSAVGRRAAQDSAAGPWMIPSLQIAPSTWRPLGVPEKDYEEALSLLAQSTDCARVDNAMSLLYRLSQNGHPPALRKYGEQLIDGDCIRRNDFGAYTVLLIARRAGMSADELESDVARRLTPEERERAGLWADMAIVPSYELRRAQE